MRYLVILAGAALVVACGTPEEVEEGYVIFATSDRHTADLGGPDGADSLCAARAEAAELEGSFVAWLSAGSVDARDRISQVGPYVRTDGTQIAESWDELLDSDLDAAISTDETGASVSGDVWTGTLPDGTRGGADDCFGFTSSATDSNAICGNSNASDGSWTDSLYPRCSTQLRVYCVEQ